MSCNWVRRITVEQIVRYDRQIDMTDRDIMRRQMNVHTATDITDGQDNNTDKHDSNRRQTTRINAVRIKLKVEKNHKKKLFIK